MISIKTHTIRANTLLSSLEMHVSLVPPLVTDITPYLAQKWMAVWDTGATRSCITHRVTEQLPLVQIGSGVIYTAMGQRAIKTYLVHIVLPGDIKIKAEVASVPDFGTDTDVVLGIDIISQLDFCISNANNRTTFSYRHPATEEIDLALSLFTQ